MREKEKNESKRIFEMCQLSRFMSHELQHNKRHEFQLFNVQKKKDPNQSLFI